MEEVGLCSGGFSGEVEEANVEAVVVEVKWWSRLARGGRRRRLGGLVVGKREMTVRKKL